MKQNKSESDDEDHVKNSDDIHKLDPFYINEDLLKQEEEQLDETQKQVIIYSGFRRWNIHDEN